MDAAVECIHCPGKPAAATCYVCIPSSEDEAMVLPMCDRCAHTWLTGPHNDKRGWKARTTKRNMAAFEVWRVLTTGFVAEDRQWFDLDSLPSRFKRFLMKREEEGI